MKRIYFYILCLFLSFGMDAQDDHHSPDRAEGEGPFSQLIIRGVTIINSTGAPPIGPMDIIIENNVIKNIRSAGYPGVESNPRNRAKLKEGGREIDATGMYVLPGFVDMHGHIGGRAQGANAEYVFKLFMAHGITTVRDPGGRSMDWFKKESDRSKRNEITAPRIFSYPVFGSGGEPGGDPISTPAMARNWVRKISAKGANGIKFFGASPEIMTAALDEAKKLGLKSACHHAQLNVGRWNVLQSARAGLTTMEHWYGLPEALFDDKTVQHYPLDYNYKNEQDRFKEAGRLWKQAAKKGSKRWNEVMDELLELDFTIDPTFTIYEASRDLQRARRAEWHETYTLPQLWKFYQPSKISHGSYWHFWGTEEEVAWKENYEIWMDFVNEYKNRGGRVTTGSDPGYIFKLYGFGYIRELELLREAGFHPLEVIRSATLNGAEALGADDKIGSIEIGKYADLIIIEENPLVNLKVLYGTGAIKLDEDNKVTRVGGVKYTIKDGIIFDAKKLLQDVKEMVEADKKERDFKLFQPGMKGKT